MILIVGQNSAWQKIYLLTQLRRAEVNRIDTVEEFASVKGVNVARALSSLGAQPEVLKVNRAELEEIAGKELPDVEGRVSAYRVLMEKFGVRWVFITFGSQGIEGFNGSALLRAKPPAVRVVNSTGSGDAAAAGIGYSIAAEAVARGKEELFGSADALQRTLCIGTAMGTANCLSTKNGLVDPKEFRSIMAAVELERVPFSVSAALPPNRRTGRRSSTDR